jgi:hypothetical protein
MYPHRIRLRGPWEVCQPGGETAAKIDMPARGSALGPAPVRLTRRFGVPRQLDPHERVWLVIDRPAAAGHVTVNGGPAGDFNPQRGYLEIDLTHDLGTRNELSVELAGQLDDRVVWNECYLEIRGTYWLRDLAVSERDTAEVEVTGWVCGPATDGLELYVMNRGRTGAYERVSASPEGSRFAVRVVPGGPAGSPNPHHPDWRVELIEGANRWFVADVEPPAGLVR